jgi:hypothetical protein
MEQPVCSPSDDDYDEDKRLHRLGIDPEGEPVDIMTRLRKRREGLEREAEDRRNSHKPADAPAFSGAPPARVRRGQGR